jgi:hypothetical protein
MGAYKVNTTADRGRKTARAVIVAECPLGGTAETIARELSRLDMGHYWVTTVTREPLTSFTGGQRDHEATGGQS